MYTRLANSWMNAMADVPAADAKERQFLSSALICPSKLESVAQCANYRSIYFALSFIFCERIESSLPEESGL